MRKAYYFGDMLKFREGHFCWVLSGFFFAHENSGSQDVPQRDYTFSRGANCHALSILGPDALKIPLQKTASNSPFIGRFP